MAEVFSYGGQTILSHPLVVETILPFLLVFTIVFAVLQKSKILGDGKRQIDAIVALVFGLLVIAFGQATGIILQLVPFLAVSLVVVLVLMILLGAFLKDNDGSFKMPKQLNLILMVLAVAAVAVAVLYITGGWVILYDFLFFSADSTLFLNILFILIIIGAVVAVLWTKKGDSGKSP